ncbi:hypothetical protein BT96DRAFT_1010638 [Gymnopus androsaceus JB14]|uniref:Uncharacterized protein n=1 Tax=Gymnopus androsaceus JB14 TaxID=1447944 RepID=A0A6A4GAF4_9AGAR|nr:hypothetical protein BT96DRAFT_1010638 [Gymnopus androsaceus JB14]
MELGLFIVGSSSIHCWAIYLDFATADLSVYLILLCPGNRSADYEHFKTHRSPSRRLYNLSLGNFESIGQRPSQRPPPMSLHPPTAKLSPLSPQQI